MQLEEIAAKILDGSGLFRSESQYIFGDGFGNNYHISRDGMFPGDVRTIAGSLISFLAVCGTWEPTTPKALLLDMGYVVNKHLDVPEWIKRLDTSIDWKALEEHMDHPLTKADKRYNVNRIRCFFEEQEKLKATSANESTDDKLTIVIDTCDHGHKFAKLPDHPRRHDMSRCPYCMSVGLDLAREQKEKQLKAILSFIEEGVDELTVRRIWERAMIEGNR